MRISIAMATYNGATHLQEQLDSFANQTRLPEELVVCDDGSTDTTLEILGRFRQRAPFDVQIYRNETNLGFTKNFEKAIANCSGDLIFLSDQDDIWFPTKVGFVENACLENSSKLLVIHDGELVDDSLVSHGTTKRGQIVAGFRTDDHLVTGALTAIRRELLPLALPIPVGIVGHDGWLHNIARFLDARFVLTQPLQYVRRHSYNTSSWVASSVNKINRLDVLKSQFSTTPAKGYEDRILMNESCQTRIKMALDNENMFSQEVVEKALCYLRAERRAVDYRSNLLHVNSLRRKVISLQLLYRGDYQYFNGYKSFLRDIVR